MSNREICYLTALGLARLIRRKSLSPVEVADAFLERIGRLNGILNAYCTLDEGRVNVAAQESEQALMRGEICGPLHGVPFSAKDLIFTAGLRTTAGSKLFADFVPNVDAVPVKRLKAAGAICLGKTNTATFGYTGVCDNLLFGITRNPWDLQRTPGGSSGGAGAAVAAGLGSLALGTDVGGSIRVPGSFCGIFGFKPSFGLVPRFPGFFGEWETMNHIGPMTRTVRDAALLLDVIKGPDDGDRWSLPALNINYLNGIESDPRRPVRAAWSPTLGYAPVEAEVRSIVEARVRSLGDVGVYVEHADPGFENPHDDFAAMIAVQTAGALGKLLPTRRDELDPDLVKVIERGLNIAGATYAEAEQRKFNLYQALAKFFARYDVLLTPTVPVPPFPLELCPGPQEINGQPVGRMYGWYPFTFPFGGLTGLPAASVPSGWTHDALPVGLQVVGRRYDDLTVLRIAARIEEAWPWADRTPPLD